MKKYKALYVAARNALSKIAGETLFLEKEPQSQEADEELLKALSATLNNRAGNGEVNPTAETVEDGEGIVMTAEQFIEYRHKLKAHQTQEPKTDWQATVKQMQAYASTVTTLLDEMESKK